MKNLAVLLLIGLLISGCSKEEPTSSDPEFFKLNVTVSGEGSCEVVPLKTEYQSGEKVTITANAESGWGLRRWDGNVTSDNNPLELIMDSDKSIRAVFNKTFEPDISGTWAGVEYLLTLELDQPSIFDSSFAGMLYLININGDTLDYTVTGHNRHPQVKMYCNRPGYYQIEYAGWYANPDRLDGGFEEAGVSYECDLVRVADFSMPLNRIGKRFLIGKQK